MVSSLINKREFRSQLVNGETFTLNPSDTTINLVGAVGAKTQATHRFELSWKSEQSSTNSFTVVSGTPAAVTPVVITQATGNFEDDGWSIGDTCAAAYRDVSGDFGPFTGVVTNVAGDTIYIDMENTFNFTGVATINFVIYGITPLTGAEWSFGLNENSDGNEIYVSKLDGEQQKFYASGVGTVTGGTTLEPTRDTTPVAMTPSGSTRSWFTGSCTINWVENKTVSFTPTFPGSPIDIATIQVFEVVHEFRILPYYQDGELSNIQTLTPPALFASGNTLKYIFKADMFQALSNPNSIKTAKENDNLGSVGWLGQNYNGFLNEYSVKSLAYVDQTSGLPLTQINGAGITEFTINIENLTGPFTASSKFIVYISLLPDPDEYQSTPTTYEQNFLLDSKLQTVGTGTASSSILQLVEGTLIGANEIEITGQISYTVAQQLQLDDTKNYLLEVEVQDDSLSNQDSDRVPVLVDTNTYIFSSDVPNLFFANESEYKVIPHNKVEADIAFTDGKLWIEDGFLTLIPFQLNTDLGASLQELSASIVAYNSITGNSFEIQRYDFNLSGSVISGGIQNISINTTRGFKLASGSIFNQVVIVNTGATTNGPHNVEGYDLKIAFKVNYEDWLQLLSVDPVFFDASKPFDGFNKLTSDFSGLNDYEIRVFLDARVSDGDSLTSYRVMSPNYQINYYHEPVIEKGWTCKIETFNQIGTNLNGAILNDEDTKIKATFSLGTGSVPSLLDLWGILRLDPFQGNINSINELSSRLASATNNPLIPSPSESFTKVSILGQDVFLECEVDHTHIDPNQGYCVSARLGSDEEPEVLVVDIESVFIGGAGGTWDLNIDIENGIGNYPGDGINYIMTFKNPDGPTVLGTVTYLTGDVIGVDAPQGTTGIGASFVTHMTGTITDNSTLTLDKRTWAETEGFIDDALTTGAITVNICVQAVSGISVSNIAEAGMIPKTSTGQFSTPVQPSFFQNELIVLSDNVNDRVRLVKANGLTKLVNASASTHGTGVDTNDISNGLPVIYDLIRVSNAVVGSVNEHRYDGTNFIKTLIHTTTATGPNTMTVDNNQLLNGKSAIWIGTDRLTTAEASINSRLLLLEWDGISAYNEIDFSARMADLATEFGAFSRLIVYQIYMDGFNTLYMVCRTTGGLDSFIARMVYNGGGYTNPANWTIQGAVGDLSGDVDGVGKAARFNQLMGISPFQNVANPKFFVSDYLPNISNIRRLDYQLGGDEWSATKVIGGIANGDVDGAGTTAQLDAPGAMAPDITNQKIYVMDENNHKVKELDVASFTSTTVAGTGLAGYDEQINF